MSGLEERECDADWQRQLEKEDKKEKEGKRERRRKREKAREKGSK